MFYVIYLISNEKQIAQIDYVYKNREDMIIKYIDKFIFKQHFNSLFENMDKGLMEEIKTELESEYKNINKTFKKVMKEEKICSIKIDLIKALNKKKISEMQTIYELNPILSYILDEGTYNKNIKYSEEVLKKCLEINITTKLIFVSTGVILSEVRKLIKSKKIQREIYFKSDFKTPIEYMVYEYKKLLEI